MSVLFVLLLVACAPRIVTVSVTVPPETVVVTATPAPSPTPTPPGPKTLTVCLVGEPDTLYLYGGSRLPASRHVMEALYDGPVDTVNYAYQPVILKKIPSPADGDVSIHTVRVEAGDRVVDALGATVELTRGVRVRPAGCAVETCTVEFKGQPLFMERLEVIFALREDVTWADGEPVTADDSIFAFQVASDPATPGSRDLVERTARYYPLTGERVKWVGLPGFVNPDYATHFFAPLPRHQLEGRAPADLLQASETRRYPLGWGPFVVKEWTPGDHITLSRNPRYFRTAEGLPRLDQVVFRFATGGAEITTRLLAGECDVGVQDAGYEPLMPMLVQAEQQGLLKVVAAPGNTWEQIDFGIKPAADYLRADFFGNVQVRQAIAQCVDRQAIVDELTYGRSVAPDGFVPPVHPLYAADRLTHWAYDPAAGQTLLDAAGWLDEDGDGVREAHRIANVRTNTPFEVTLLTDADNPVSEQVARIVKANLADCGIRVNLAELPAAAFSVAGPSGLFLGRRFDLAETTQQFDGTPHCERYLSSAIPDRGHWVGENANGYSSPAYDAACWAALQALPGTAEYAEYQSQAQAVFSADLPALPLVMSLRVALARPGVLNLALDSSSPSELWNIEAIDVER